MRAMLGSFLLACLGPAAGAEPAYVVRNHPVPEGVAIEAGGLAYWEDGTLVFSTRRGDVWTVRDGRWNLFASGLLEPMGIWAETVGEVYVVDSHELTRLRDLDGDLAADRYETVTADWEVPGATADFVYGLCRDAEGNFYGTMHTSHGPWARKSLPPGVTLKKGQLHGRHSVNNFGGPMGAPVIGRGWSYRVDPAGELTWWSSGLRAPNGVGFNAEGALFATDNQGDWVGTSALHHIEQGDCHGHPSSYFWDPKRTLDMDRPLDELAAELDKIRKRPAVLFPHGILGNSPSQPVLAPADGSFGPFAGQFFVGDNVAPLLSRVYLEKVNGAYQGVCFPFLRGEGLNKALCRMVFSPEGTLMIGFGCRGWGPATTGLQEVAWTGTVPFEMQQINLLRDGFRITFTKPLAEQELALAVQSYRYKYHHTYGSPQVDKGPVAISATEVSADRRAATLRMPALEEGRIYEFQLPALAAADGSVLANRVAYYTLNRRVAEAPAAARWDFFPLCMDTHDAAKRSLAEQAALLRELGYDGCGHICQDLGYGNITHPPDTTLEQRAATLEAEGLRVVQAYGRVHLQREVPIDFARLAEMMPVLAKHRSQLVLLLLGDREADLDGRAVEVLGRLADLARPHGVPVVLYPHSTDYTETLGEALRVAKTLNRPGEVGVMFTFSHWKVRDPNRNLRAVLGEAGPWLKAAYVNGTTREGAPVLPLGEGDYEVREVLEVLREINFRGPVGLMCWSIRGDAREHLEASMGQWRAWTAPVRLDPDGETCRFATPELNGRIGDGRFIGLNQVVHAPTGTSVSGGGRANRHGLLTLYRVFTRNHRHGTAAYDWKEREMAVEDGAVVMRWAASGERPFRLQARYTFPEPRCAELEVTVEAMEDLVDFEVQVASYFDAGFPDAAVRVGDGRFVSSPRELGTWHAFPRDDRAREIIADGRWSHGPSPVDFVMRPEFSTPVSLRRHPSGLEAVLSSPPGDCFAIYTAHDGEAHYSNYHALFGRTVKAGESATAKVSLRLRD